MLGDAIDYARQAQARAARWRDTRPAPPPRR